MGDEEGRHERERVSVRHAVTDMRRLNQDHSDPDVVYMYVRITKTVHLLVEAVEQGRLLARRPEMLLL
jgi:hypothetical protein